MVGRRVRHRRDFFATACQTRGSGSSPSAGAISLRSSNAFTVFRVADSGRMTSLSFSLRSTDRRPAKRSQADSRFADARAAPARFPSGRRDRQARSLSSYAFSAFVFHPGAEIHFTALRLLFDPIRERFEGDDDLAALDFVLGWTARAARRGDFVWRAAAAGVSPPFALATNGRSDVRAVSEASRTSAPSRLK